ncbi:MAG: bifunctional pyr operon transcriptional regulator/uracil phosphoribosyltransferase [bacterium (Candidatus Stahlbacteria) CG23_combo_of_CG06-09_8_20_14_all_34_7]|nr:MAG: bifunctional pyr operon transcriptional regulator/uracil phosphoribosyltransferase [bacterium (Candidatus Stahlbacteria) CG23_combo_of_CG06-09_8_20_14_all_34_7]
MTKDFKLMGEKELQSIINSMATDILKSKESLKDIVFVGIIKRGDIIAKRVANIIEQVENCKIPIGRIDINLYRDDLSIIDYHPKISSTEIQFDLNDKIVYLFDDVFFTGRTIRSAMNEIMDFGRPQKIKLYVIIDRKKRELPILPDFSGSELNIPKNKIVNVHFTEIDGIDEIILLKEEN